MYKKLIYLLLATIVLYGCKKEDVFTNNGTVTTTELQSGWTVPLDQLLLSQLPEDRIQSIDDPYFEKISNNNLNRNALYYAYFYDNTVKIYPQRIIGGHEIINDHIDNHYYTISYCPLTGSAIAWDRQINGTITEFGVSGHLFKDNLVPYDRKRHSYWSQMRMHGIKGDNAGYRLKTEFLLTTSGNTIINSFPDALILTDTTGHQCTDSICGGLKEIVDYGEPGDDDNSVIPLVGNYFGIVNIGLVNGGEGALLFNYSMFNDSITLYHTNYRNSNVIIIGSKTHKFIVAFKNTTGNPSSDFFAVQNSLPVVFSDINGNKYDILGVVISGPLVGTRLQSPPSYWANNTAWNRFFGSKLTVFE